MFFTRITHQPFILAEPFSNRRRSRLAWGKSEFRSEAPQISLRKCADRAPKFRASFAQISWGTQAINCVNIQRLHTPLPTYYPTLICALSPPCACYCIAQHPREAQATFVPPRSLMSHADASGVSSAAAERRSGVVCQDRGVETRLGFLSGQLSRDPVLDP